MTSVGVISSAVARIKCLKELLESLPSEGEELLKGLEGIKESLEAAANGEPEENFAEMEKEIMRLSYDIVDAIADASLKPKEKSYVSKLTQRKKSGNTTKLRELQQQLNDFQEELDKHKPKGKLLSVSKLIQRKKKNEEIPTRSQAQGEKKQNPGQEDEEKEKGGKDVDDLFHQLRDELLNGSMEGSVVGIVGQSGMGKTTLARRLFHDHQLRLSVNLCAWVPINHNFQIKRVLQVLLQQLLPPQELDMRDMNEIQLINHIFAVLNNKTYLLVLDDIRAPVDWESIRLALPISHSSAVIITTSSKEFQLPRFYRIPGMTQPEILRLLKKKANFKNGLEGVGKAIFDISDGSPLLATILGKSLQSEAAVASEQDWVVDELHSYESQKGTARVLGACYMRLAPELKLCLLYLGQFPLGQDIEFEKLYLLLVAENLISSKESKISPQSLKHYLGELAGKKLVEVQEDVVSDSGMYKSCRLHDQVRELCKFKGLDEEFFEVVDLGSSTKVGLHSRRLAIDLSKYRGDDNSIQFNSRDTLKKILSLLIFDTFESAEENSEWPSGINDLKELIHLRILNFDGVDFKVRKVPRGMDRLVLLRYLSFRGCWLEELPSSISNLTQLETLDLVVQADCKVTIPNNVVTNMKRMMHLYFPRLYETSGKRVQLQGLERLEILVNFDTEACDVKALSQLKNLKTLSTISYGHSEDLAAVIDFINNQQQGLQLHHSSVEIRSFDCYNRQSVSALKKLVRCQLVQSIHIEGQVGELQRTEEGGEKVSALILDGSELEDDPMGYLGMMFHNLRSLVLSNNAFLGGEIVISAELPFPNLRSLKLQNLQYLEKLRIETGAMPRLLSLQIKGCACLLQLSIPKELDDRLTKAQGDNRGDAYSIMPPPKSFSIS